MAARPAGANPPALKIKLKPRREPLPAVPNVGSASPQPIPIQPVGPSRHKNEDDDKGRTLDGEINRPGTLKRKLPSPSSSPAPKRCGRQESPVSESRIPLSASGKPLEVFPGRSEQLSTEPLVVKQRLGQRHASIASLILREQALQRPTRLEDDDARSNKLKSPALPLENISHGQLQVISVVPSNLVGPSAISSPGKQDDLSQNESVSRASADSQTNQQVYPITRSLPQQPGENDVTVIPTHAGWFAWDHIHKLERQGLPHLFYGKSKLQSPELYVQVRNAMVFKYRQNPRKPLGLSDIRGLSSFDDRESNRLLEFLIHWGLVNYQAEPDLKTMVFKYPWKVPVYLGEDGSGALHSLPLFLTPLERLYQYEALRAPAIANLALKNLATTGPSTIMAENVIKEAHISPQSLVTGNYCGACGAHTPQKYYHCEQADYILCANCIGDGKFGIGMTSMDFIVLNGCSEAVESSGNGSWSDQETLMLLEALEIHGENWTDISEFVGTKSKAQCISHFIGLPIEDRFLEDMEIPRAFITAEARRTESVDAFRPRYPEDHVITTNISEVRASAGLDRPEPTLGTKLLTAGRQVTRLHGEIEQHGISDSADKLKPEDQVAFAEAGNPVMALVAFLVGMVGPRVAAAAAHTALSSLSEDHQTSQASADTQDQNRSMPSIRVPCSTDLNSHMTIRDASVASMDDNTGKVGAKGEKNLEDKHRMQDGQCGLSKDSMKKATAAALAAAAVKAKLLADHEEREIQRLAAIIVDNQLKKLDVKLKQLGDVDPALDKECEQTERNRQRLSTERIRFAGARLGSPTLPTQMPVSATPNSFNIRPPGAAQGSNIPATILTATTVHSSAMPRQTLYTIGPGGMPVPVSASIVKPPS